MKNLTTIIAGSLVALAFLALGSQAYAFESAADIQARLTELREIHADLKAQGVDALGTFVADVREGAFPADDECYHLSDEQAEALGLYGSRPVNEDPLSSW